MFIIEVFPDGAAGKDGRLQSGDQILDMCANSFKEIEHEKAHGTVLKVTGTVRNSPLLHVNYCVQCLVVS